MCRAACALAATSLDLAQYLQLGGGCIVSSANSVGMMAELFEAVLGAISEDSGYRLEAVQHLLLIAYSRVRSTYEQCSK